MKKTCILLLTYVWALCIWLLQYQKGDVSLGSVEIEEVMDTWTLQMGYPVVTVSLTGDQVSATQERFLFNSHSNFTEEFISPYGLDPARCVSACVVISVMLNVTEVLIHFGVLSSHPLIDILR